MKKTLPLYLGLVFLAGSVYGQKDVGNELATFAAQTGATTTIDKATNGISFMRFPTTRAFKASGGTAEAKALNFVSQNSSLLGIKSGRDEYRVKKSERDQFGLEHVVLQKFMGGVPVFDGILKFHFNKATEITSMNGNTVVADKLNLQPSITQEEAEAFALRKVEGQKLLGKEGSKRDQPLIPLKVHQTSLYVFQKGLAQGYNGTKHLVYEVEVRNDADVREFLYIDAHSKVLVEQFTGIHAALNRKLYQPTYNSASPNINLVWKEGDAFPGTKPSNPSEPLLNQWQQSELESAGQVYHFMKNAFGRISYNNADAPMITTHNNPGIQCPNANWNGVSANYCDQTAADDVVAHEWGHAYTEYTSGLIYAWQSGALNESYSDIWGETIDLINNYFDTGEGMDFRNVDGTDNPVPSVTTRWRMGEQASAFGSPDGAIRDMYNPNNFDSPGKVSDLAYHCSASDGGGVHINSGINNHAYALLVDGGIYNGQTITGIGLVKAAHIFWRVQSHYLTQTSDFYTQADALEAAAYDLYTSGANLRGLSVVELAQPTLSGLKIEASDLVQLHNVLLAVEMRNEINCGFPTLLANVADECEGANTGVIYSEDFEDGLTGWDLSTVNPDATFTPRSWVAISNAPRGRAGTVAYGVDYPGGDCEDQLESGVIRMESPMITIPNTISGNISMSFDHYIATEEAYDGGNIEFSINGGAWQTLPASAFIANGYNKNLASSSTNTNPLAGQAAFSGYNYATLGYGSWGQSQINLSAAGVNLQPGQTIKLAWKLGTDACGGIDGWYVDDIKIYSCAVPAVHFVESGSVVNEGEATVANNCLNYVEKIIAVQIDKAPSAPVTVNLVANSPTAIDGVTGDYTFSPSSVVLSAQNLVQNIIVRVYNDDYVEGDEDITFTYTINSGGGDGFAATDGQSHKMTITDNDLVPNNGIMVPVFSESFDSGISNWKVTNGGNSGETWHPVVSYFSYTLNNTPFLFVDSDAPGTDAVVLDEAIDSPVINTLGMKNLVLSFKQYFLIYNGGYNEQALVQIWDGTTWRTILTQTQATGTKGTFANPNTVTLNIPDAYANAKMKIRFVYKANFDYYWAIDDVSVTRTPANQIQATIASSPSQYLGPNATAYFYGPEGDLIAKIFNKTNHDYGCTTVEVDRIGTDVTTWLKSYQITNKTFKVTPTTNNPNGQYEITLYYKASELLTFNGAAVKSMGKSAGGIGVGNIANTSYAEVQASSIYGTDYAYTATFDSGFSGFGLSDAPPVGSLPVKLVKFEGAHGVEGNVLKWETTSEENNEYFAVERARDAKAFQEIGRVVGSGTSAITNRYQFTDTKFAKGINYYRLRQVDYNGSTSYSNIIPVDALNLRALKFFPNPVQAILNIELPDVDIKQVSVKVVNISGRVVMEKSGVKISNGVVSQDVSDLGSGLYQVIISDGVETHNFSVVKM